MSLDSIFATYKPCFGGGDTYDQKREQEMKYEIQELIQFEGERVLQNCCTIVLRRTEIPKGALNPTRDAVVELGEVLVELLKIHGLTKLTENRDGKSIKH